MARLILSPQAGFLFGRSFSFLVYKNNRESPTDTTTEERNIQKPQSWINKLQKKTFHLKISTYIQTAIDAHH